MPHVVLSLLLLPVSIALIVWLTAFKKVNAFFALLAAALLVGMFSGLPATDIVNTLKTGFGHTLQKIGLLILVGTTLGVVLEKTGATQRMAEQILHWVNEKNAPAAMGITGFIVGLPIFCDSAFIILSGLNHSLVRKTRIGMPVMASVLATSVYAVHCLVPPHPGITAAVGTIGADMGMVMLGGIALAVPVALTGYLWSMWRGKKFNGPDDALASAPAAGGDDRQMEQRNTPLPPAWLAFLPVLLPIILIGGKSAALFALGSPAMAEQASLRLLSLLGEPEMALMIALLCSLFMVKKAMRRSLLQWLTEGVEKAGMILAIVGGGGMFGEMIQATGMGKDLGEWLGGFSLGIFFPFLVSAMMKTAQGSTTVAIITASTLVTPVLAGLHLQSPAGLTLTVLSMGAGSMVVSHANDAYFWIISRFSGLDSSTTLKTYSLATLWMGLVAQGIIWVFSFWIH